MSYDDNGNLTGGRGRSIQWDSDNRPIQINTSSFAYDGIGGRLKKTSPGSASLYPFGDDYEVTNGVITKYITAEGVGIVAKRVGGQTFWLHTDRLGSIQAITDGTGADVQHRTYRPYGEQIAATSTHTESRGYIGERRDEDTGLTYLHARYYDPALGVFISADPAERPNGSLVYGYAANDPIDLSDPTGLDPNPPTNPCAGAAHQPCFPTEVVKSPGIPASLLNLILEFLRAGNPNNRLSHPTFMDGVEQQRRAQELQNHPPRPVVTPTVAAVVPLQPNTPPPGGPNDPDKKEDDKGPERRCGSNARAYAGARRGIPHAYTTKGLVGFVSTNSPW